MIAQIQKTILDHWNLPAISDYHGERFLYSDVAGHIAQLHALFRQAGIQRGDRIALCGPNSARWGVAFMAVVAYGAVVVPILNDFQPDQIHHIVNHSESKILFAAENILATTTPSEMPGLTAILRMADYTVAFSSPTGELQGALPSLSRRSAPLTPPLTGGGRERASSLHFEPERDENDLMMINYTSGTTGFSKGVMLPYRAFDSNFEFAQGALDRAFKGKGTGVVLALLPMAHMYGLMFDFIYVFLRGSHTCIMTRTPSPNILAKALAEVQPDYITAVPLIIEKIVRKQIMKKISSSRATRFIKMPLIGNLISKMMRRQVSKVFGGHIYEIIVGGAPLNQEVEAFLRSFRFPLTVGYGATECAPIITFSDYHQFAPGSCGRCVVNMEVRIDSSNPQQIPGEILTRGKNVMLGYYKNPEATAEVLDAEGWYHTGDLAVMDAKGNVFIKGRKKNMLLGPNGQNIYPEEIEDKLNSMLMVSESLIVQRNGRLEALVHPDYEEAYGLNLSDENIQNIMELNRTDLNEIRPAYERIQAVHIMKEEFAKTPKRSIKRYLYK